MLTLKAANERLAELADRLAEHSLEVVTRKPDGTVRVMRAREGDGSLEPLSRSISLPEAVVWLEGWLEGRSEADAIGESLT